MKDALRLVRFGWKPRISKPQQQAQLKKNIGSLAATRQDLTLFCDTVQLKPASFQKLPQGVCSHHGVLLVNCSEYRDSISTLACSSRKASSQFVWQRLRHRFLDPGSLPFGASSQFRLDFAPNPFLSACSSRSAHLSLHFGNSLSRSMPRLCFGTAPFSHGACSQISTRNSSSGCHRCSW